MIIDHHHAQEPRAVLCRERAKAAEFRLRPEGPAAVSGLSDVV